MAILSKMVNLTMLTWFKKNWALSILILIGLVYLKNTSSPRLFPSTTSKTASLMAPEAYDLSANLGSAIPSRQVAPSSSPDRIVITDTSLSLQVKDVSQTIKNIDQQTKDLGGFLVSSHLSKPELAASGNITVRIPSDKLQLALESFRSLAVKVVSESIVGTDVTDQYEDLDARLDVLNKTKAKFESIMDQATKITDLLEVQRELVNLQTQIDNIKGRQDYLTKSANLSKVVIYLSTDDLSLPYAPTNVWRPIVTVKTAVRSLLTTLRSLGNLVIWNLIPILAIPKHKIINIDIAITI